MRLLVGQGGAAGLHLLRVDGIADDLDVGDGCDRRPDALEVTLGDLPVAVQSETDVPRSRASDLPPEPFGEFTGDRSVLVPDVLSPDGARYDGERAVQHRAVADRAVDHERTERLDQGISQ
ncbi:hypothetical protein [Streptomyces spongiae]|uniref:hypothetical protein n=1 Tax=Streptomyces spongiae TaxID=565072 RepID=UPI001D1434EC|nr:hypothetical protein [Streptomyces spongiae]